MVADLPQEEVDRLLAAGRRRNFAKGEVIFHEGDLADTLHFILKGRVAATVTSRYGQQLTFGLMGVNQFFGEVALIIPDSIRTATMRALEPTETRSIQRVDFEGLRRQHPGMNELLVRILADRVARLSDRLQEALYVAVETRVRRRLIEVAQLYGEGAPGTVIPLTQEDLAGLAGTARATVNRVLRQEEIRGSLSLGRHRITIIDPPAIASRAELA
jgi:CRP-like cAMP-binding protein